MNGPAVIPRATVRMERGPFTATRAQVTKAAETLGVSFSSEGRTYSLDAPRGSHFLRGDGKHFRVWDNESGSWPLPELYGDMIDFLGYGITDCDADCECRQEGGE